MSSLSICTVVGFVACGMPTADVIHAGFLDTVRTCLREPINDTLMPTKAALALKSIAANRKAAEKVLPALSQFYDATSSLQLPLGAMTGEFCGTVLEFVDTMLSYKNLVPEPLASKFIHKLLFWACEVTDDALNVRNVVHRLQQLIFDDFKLPWMAEFSSLVAFTTLHANYPHDRAISMDILLSLKRAAMRFEKVCFTPLRCSYCCFGAVLLPGSAGCNCFSTKHIATGIDSALAVSIPPIQFVFFIWHRRKECMKRIGAATGVTRMRRERLAQACELA